MTGAKGDELVLNNNTPNCRGGYEVVSCTFCHFFAMISGIIKFALMNIVFPLAILMLIAGGALFILSAGDPGRINQGKTIMKSAVIGILIILLAWVVVNTILNFSGIVNTSLSWNPANWFQIECQ